MRLLLFSDYLRRWIYFTQIETGHNKNLLYLWNNQSGFGSDISYDAKVQYLKVKENIMQTKEEVIEERG